MRNDAGFSLIESVISVAVVASGVLGVATLFIMGTGLQLNARDNTTAINLAVAETERLRMLPRTAAERTDGGSLTTNVANHFAVRGTTTLRWTIADGPACGIITWAGAGGVVECTKVMTTVGVSPNNRSMTPQIVTQVWR
jgi:Tfp pilus assembly protein PilV